MFSHNFPVETPNEYTRIDIPEVRYEAEAEFATSTSSIQIRRRKDKEKFPSEKRKTLIALVWFVACLMITCLFITLGNILYRSKNFFAGFGMIVIKPVYSISLVFGHWLTTY